MFYSQKNHRYQQVPFAFLLLPKLFTFDSFAKRVPNWIAFFLKVEAFSSPSQRATLLRSIFSPLPQVRISSGTVRKYSQSGRQRKGYLVYLPFIPMALSSRPKFLIHNLSISKIISFSISSQPARLKAILQREQPAKISSAPNPDATIFAEVPAEAMCSAVAMLKSICVVFGQIFLMSSFLTFQMSSRVLLRRMRLNCLLGLSDRNSSQEILAASRSGASSLKARLTKSICSSLGRVRSSSRAMSVESMPPENMTAILELLSLELQSKTPLMHRVISRTLQISSFRTVMSTSSMGSGCLWSPSLGRSIWWICYFVQKAYPFLMWMEMSEFAGNQNSCFFLLDSHSASYFTFQLYQLSYSPAFTLSASSALCISSQGELVSIK